jgi:hypothetical protein
MVHEPSTGKNTLANLMKTISKQAGYIEMTYVHVILKLKHSFSK